MQIFFSYVLIFIAMILSQSIFDPLFIFKELNYLSQPYDLRGIVKGIIYFSTYVLTVITFTVIIGLRSFKIFILFLSVIFILYAIDFFIQLIGTAHGFSASEYALIVNEISNYKYLLSYIDYILYSLMLSFLFVIVIYIIRKKIYKSRFSTISLLIIVIPISIVYLSASKISSIHFSTFTAITKIPAIVIDYKRKSKTIKDRVFDNNIKPTSIGKFNNIVWVIDESITGSYLSINGYKQETTPYLDSLLKETNKISNFGVVNSISNCSSQSNLFLRIGMNPNLDLDFKKSIYNLPTIFQYAKRAGYTTWLLDSQAKKDHLQNHLTLYDKEDIDHFETLSAEVIPRNRDKKLLNILKKVLKGDKDNKNFIVVVKFGAHWPYLLAYDNKNSPFKPTMDVTYGGMDTEHKEKQINTYQNLIVYSTDLYLKDLISKLDLSDTVIFYTSDHGQNILELDTVKRTHCNKETVVKNEVSVPLLIFHNDAKKLFPANKELFYSQIQIFPTTLSLLGYGDNIVQQYGKTLWEGFSKSDDRKYFLLMAEKVNIYK